MAERMAVKCIRRCYDNKRGIRYYPGDIENVDPLSSLALYFEFPPGTKVHHKEKVADGFDEKGKAKFKMVSTTRIVGDVPEKEDKETEEICEFCNSYKGTKKQIKGHQMTCQAKLQHGTVDKE